MSARPAKTKRQAADLDLFEPNVVPIGGTESSPGMALSLAVPTGPRLSEGDRVDAVRRYNAIEPLLKPEKFPEIWAANRNRNVDVAAWSAKHSKTTTRNIYRWWAAFKEGGLPALVRKGRADKAIPKVLNLAALEFLLAAALPKHGAYGKLSVRDIFRAYEEERQWRKKQAGLKLCDTDRAKYARYTTTEGHLTAGAQLPKASYSTFVNWFGRIPQVAKVMARDGDEAFHNTQEIISFRDLTAVQPLDYVVMDHRRLDIFCLIPNRSGWSLARPWLTGCAT